MDVEVPVPWFRGGPRGHERGDLLLAIDQDALVQDAHVQDALVQDALVVTRLASGSQQRPPVLLPAVSPGVRTKY